MRLQGKTAVITGGTSGIGLATARQFLARLAALVPKPRVHLTRFHGVFAPNSAHRARVTKAGRGKGATGQVAAETDDTTSAQRRASMSWAQRLKRVFGIEIETKLGVRRGAAHHRLHRRSRIDDLRVIEKILAHLHEVPVRDAKAAAAQAARPPPSRAASARPSG